MTNTSSAITSSATTMRCTTCGGDNVLRDAWACWSNEQQTWELAQVFDHTFCEDCETDCQIELV